VRVDLRGGQAAGLLFAAARREPSGVPQACTHAKMHSAQRPNATGWQPVLPRRPAMFHRRKDSTTVRAMSVIADNLERVRAQIAEAAQKANRSVDDIQLIAISKTHDAERVREAFEAGQEIFGESRVQEARVKIPELPSAIRWHFVGHLQKNKVRHALPLFELIHSVDSLALARDIDRIAQEEGLHPRVLLEVNVAGEGTKFGFTPGKLREEMESLLALPRLSILGLMCIPPLVEEAEASRKYFIDLRELRDRLQAEFHVDFAQLSMGMTQDYAVAIEEGATRVRVGTAIFGERKRKKL
jgi:PLP dependent protein